MQSSITNFYDWGQKQRKKVYKKYGKKGIPALVLHQRACASAIMITEEMSKISFDELSLNMYLICGDSKFHEFSKAYESMLELAKLNPDQFVVQLYPFYDKMAKQIKKENMLNLFFDFFVFFQEQMISGKADNLPVFSAYMDILLGQTEFLRKDKFDFNNVLVGVTTSGEPIEIIDKFPSFDLASYMIEMEIADKDKNLSRDALIRLIEKTYKKYGYSDINTYEDVEMLRLSSKLLQNNLDSIAAYINEYTMDILPEDIVKPLFNPDQWPAVKTDHTGFKEILRKRRRTLPANGYIVRFDGSKMLHKILMKEIYHAGKIVLLYRVWLNDGEVAGWYNTKDKLFYGPYPYQQENGRFANKCLETVILWAYAAYVCNEAGISQDQESYLTYLDDNTDVELGFSGIPGKLRPVYQASNADHPISTSDQYETAIKSIAGYIRKLPKGQHPSERAVKLAAEIGLEPEPNETYVQPFMRACWVVKSVPER